MNKFKFSFKIKELELQVEGTREDAQTISTSIGKQFANLLQPTGALGENQANNPPLHVTEDGEITEVRTSQRKRRTNGGGPRSERQKLLISKTTLPRMAHLYKVGALLIKPFGYCMSYKVS